MATIQKTTLANPSQKRHTDHQKIDSAPNNKP